MSIAAGFRLPGLVQRIGFSLVAEELDLFFFQGKPLNHGCPTPVSMLRPHGAQSMDAWTRPGVCGSTASWIRSPRSIASSAKGALGRLKGACCL